MSAEQRVELVDTLIEARWVLPIEPAGAVLEDHAVAITAGRIAALGPSEVLRGRFNAVNHLRLDQHVLMPGLINAHAHSAMALLRGVGDDLPLMRWLTERVWPIEQGLVSEAFVYDGSKLAAIEMLRAGITCCSDMYFYPQSCARALRDSGMRAVVGIIAIEFPSAYASDAADYLAKGLATRDALRDDPLVSFTLAPHAPYTVSDATFERVVLLAEELDTPIHLHVHETAREVDESMVKFGMRPLARLQKLGVLSERLIAVHAVHLSPGEIELLAAAGASVAHCPASNLKLASGIAPIAQLLDAGVNLAIGTDGAASNNKLDLLAELRLAALLAKGASGNAAVLPAMQALQCVTLNAARALGLGERIGSIVVGKEADLTAIDLSAPETQPVFEPASQLVYASGREQISDVWVAGKHVVRARQVITHQGTAPDSVGLSTLAAWHNRARLLLSRPADQ
jgi:5-methylthioadenosine/S-adenosylhomocysteine deaminase